MKRRLPEDLRRVELKMKLNWFFFFKKKKEKRKEKFFLI
jgi:hypothetical protein